MPLNVLKDVFGFDGFRPGQEAVIRAALEGRDTLAVLPTGGGKSLCYQVPALMSDGLTVVVSPLISLIKDQVDSLSERSVKTARALHSGLSPEERSEVMRGVRDGGVRMLYVAPERLRSLEFVLSLKRAGVERLVVDEAHCISEWGHDFRPDYLFLPRAVADLGSPPVLALTATATPRVRQDILRSLKMREPEVIVTGFNRPNLTYRVLEAAEKNKLSGVLEVIRKGSTPAVVYGATRKECEGLAAGLARAGVKAEHFHAGMSPAARARAQERFMNDEVDVMVATIAFGMGVDKSNVRLVVHASVPGSLPAYAQESGRAGRDGGPSSCVVVYREYDLRRRERLAACAGPTRDQVETFLRILQEAAGPRTPSGYRVNAPAASLASLAGIQVDAVGILLGAMERAGLLVRGYDLWKEIEVLRVEEEQEGLTEPVSRVHSALPGEGIVSLPDLAKKAWVSPAVAEGAVIKLLALGAVEAIPRASCVDVRLARDPGTLLREGARRRIGEWLKARRSTALSQLRDVEAYAASADGCRRERLLRHFGDAEEVAPCSGCDVCLGEVEGPRRTPERQPSKPGGTTLPVLASVAAVRGEPHPTRNPAKRVPEPDHVLLETLRRWRLGRARERGIPAYAVLHDSHLEEIARRKPSTLPELNTIKGIGIKRATSYGEEILALIENPAGEHRTEGRSDRQDHLSAAEKLLRSPHPSAAVPELVRALECGGEEAREAVDHLLLTLHPVSVRVPQRDPGHTPRTLAAG